MPKTLYTLYNDNGKRRYCFIRIVFNKRDKAFVRASSRGNHQLNNQHNTLEGLHRCQVILIILYRMAPSLVPLTGNSARPLAGGTRSS